MERFFSGLSVTLLVVGCSARMLDVGSIDGGSETRGSTGGSAAASGGNSGSCAATCATPAGLVQRTFSSQEEVYSIFEGQWRLCSGGSDVFPGIPSDVIGVEFDAPPDMSSDGNMDFLVQGSDGPVKGQGFAYQWRYNLYPEGGNFYQFDWGQTGGWGTVAWLYSPCPKELQIPQMYGDAKALLVSF